MAEIRGVLLTARELRAAQKLIDTQPWLSREEVARRLCRRWGLRLGDGRWAVRSCGNALERLERLGRLRLPVRRRVGNHYGSRRPSGAQAVEPSLVAARAGARRLDGTLVVRPIDGDAQCQRWREDIEREHYLGASALVGESLCYTAWIGTEVVAHLGWAGAVLRNGARDRYLGWDGGTKRARLREVVQNVRFLILHGVEQPNLASRILGANLRRLRADWREAHGHEVWLAETFVDRSRFLGTCYHAANWLYLGQTRGFSRRGASYIANGAPKAVFVYPLHRRARERLQRPVTVGAGAARVKEEERMSRVMLDVEKLPLVGEGGLFEVLEGLLDPRHARGKRHTMPSVLALGAVATLCGVKSVSAMAQFGAELPEPFRRRLGVRPLRPPSEQTFRRLFGAIDARALDQRLGPWMAAQSALSPEQGIAIDGKSLRRSFDGEAPPVHLVGALAHTQGVVVAQQRVADKSNEITAVVPLLEGLAIEGTVVTGDAMFNQREIATHLVEEKKADYLFVVKDNQPTLRAGIQHLGHGAFSPGGPSGPDRR